MVRHPLESLVSAYQDKIAQATIKSYAKLRTTLITLYGNVTFPNFVKLILQRSKKQCRHLTRCGMDRHWKPFISRCAYCDIPYAVIAKAESFQKDQKFIGKMAGVEFEN